MYLSFKYITKTLNYKGNINKEISPVNHSVCS